MRYVHVSAELMYRSIYAVSVSSSTHCMYHTQGLLDVDIKPLSPTNEHLMKYTTEQSLQTEVNDDPINQPQHSQSRPQPVLVPTYSLPGAADDEVSFETWKKQQQQHQHPILAPQQVINKIPSFSHPTSHVPAGENRPHGESFFTGRCEETDSALHSEVQAKRVGPSVQEAWGSQTQLPGGELLGDHESAHRAVRATSEVRDTQKKEKIISDW